MSKHVFRTPVVRVASEAAARAPAPHCSLTRVDHSSARCVRSLRESAHRVSRRPGRYLSVPPMKVLLHAVAAALAASTTTSWAAAVPYVEAPVGAKPGSVPDGGPSGPLAGPDAGVPGPVGPVAVPDPGPARPSTTAPSSRGGATEPSVAGGAPSDGSANAAPTLPAAAAPWTIAPIVHFDLDAYTFAGKGVSAYQRADGTGLDSGMTIARLRTGVRGSFAQHFHYFLFLEFGPANSAGPLQSFAFRGGATIATMGYKVSDALAITIGQMPVPVTLENLRPLPFFDFNSAARTTLLGARNPLDIGAMVSGAPGPLVYAAGVFNGEGRNRGPGSQGDAAGRFAYRVNNEGSRRLQIGASGRYGFVNPRTNWADAPNMTTGYGYSYWSGTYVTNPVGVPTEVHILPSNAQKAIAADVSLELDDFSLQAEGLAFSSGMREATRGAEDAAQTIRRGALYGYSYYVTAGYWLVSPGAGERASRWEPFTLLYPAKRAESPFKPSLLLLARWEQVFGKYDSTSRSGSAQVERGFFDQYTNNIRVDAFSLELAYFLSLHFKVGLEWDLYSFPGKTLPKALPNDPGRPDNQALAPGQVVQGERGTRVNPDAPRDVSVATNPSWFQPPSEGARTLHELSLRFHLLF